MGCQDTSPKLGSFWLPCPYLCGKLWFSLINPGPMTGRWQVSVV